LWEVLWEQKLLIAAIGSVFAIGSVIVALLLSPVYRSEAVLAPVSAGQPQGLASELGGLASLAGIRLGGGNETNTYVAILRSRSFAESFIRDHDLMKVFFANEWDPATEGWRNPDRQPTMFNTVKYFRENVFIVQEDLTTGLVTIAVEWYDPNLAAAWVNDLVMRINEETRQRALREAQQNLRYLRAQLEAASVVELRRAISQLIENEMNTEMLAEAREEYAFKVVDPGMVPTQRVRPHRTLIVVASTVLGGLLAIFIALLRHSIRRQLRARLADTQ
jgi:uncharacterized protein involved in exopolysaccharide biosynthesis